MIAKCVELDFMVFFVMFNGWNIIFTIGEFFVNLPDVIQPEFWRDAMNSTQCTCTMKESVFYIGYIKKLLKPFVKIKEPRWHMICFVVVVLLLFLVLKSLQKPFMIHCSNVIRLCRQ